MPTIKQVVGSRLTLSTSAIATLAAGTYVASETYTPNTNNPVDVIVELMAGTTNTPGGNFRVQVFGQDSLDGTNFRTGPVAGTTSADEADLTPLGVLALNTSLGTSLHRGFFSVANGFGYVPYAFRIVFKNDVGVALTSATAFVSEISMTVT